MTPLIEAVVGFFLLVGALFALVGSIALARLPDLYSRLHGPTKATTLGVGGVLVASTIYFSTSRGELSIHELLVLAFLFMTAPVSAHLMAKAALHMRLPNVSGAPGPSEARPSPGATTATTNEEKGSRPS